MMRYILIGSAGLAVLAGIQTYRVERLKSELAGLEFQYAELGRAYTSHKESAKQDAQIQADQCEARVMGARLSARRIETIVEREVARDSSGCPVSSIVPASELREAVQPDAPTP